MTGAVPCATRQRARRIARHYPLDPEEGWLELHERAAVGDQALADLAAAHEALLDARHELALLIEAANEHQRACEREVSKAAWGRANGELYRARLALERGRPPTIAKLRERVGWSLGQTAERLGISVGDVRWLVRAGELERSDLDR